jgi:general secretion pathway protein K
VTAVARQRGFALLMVLWTLILLAFVAMVYVENARTEVFLARNLVDNAQAEALADGGVYQAVAGLNREPADGGYYADGRVYVWPNEAGEVRFFIRDEGGKIDVNQAPDVLLRELLVVVGADPGLSAALADAIIDFRDEDDDKRPRGAEAREYRTLGLDYGPKNERIVLLDELIYIPGMTADLLDRLRPLLTTFGQEEVPHAPTAPPHVREAVHAALAAARGGGRDAGAGGRTGSATGSETSAFTSSGATGRSSSGQFSSDGNFGSGRSSFGSGRSSFGRGSAFGGAGGFGEDDDALDDAEGSPFGEGRGEEEDEGDRSGGTVFSVHAEARTLNGTIFVREAIVDLASAEDQPFVFHAWRQGIPLLFPDGG